MQDKTHLFETKKKKTKTPTHLEIGFSWNAAKHDLMSNACLSACLFKTHGFLLLGSFIWVVGMYMTGFLQELVQIQTINIWKSTGFSLEWRTVKK